ncbi:murein biosynthesis integral membrane protein MurJ, partial [Roseisolibacter sp. H3M3-2]|uniref:murein biosynthesis integral membrane protein MurJ n=1 Tax=Roseisolibacter sp. H3M3-2 TaxID=3031323 RepID=UPI0023DB81B2
FVFLRPLGLRLPARRGVSAGGPAPAREAPGVVDPTPSAPRAARPQMGGGLAAALVGLGILASRILGLVRQGTFSHYLGAGAAADAYNAAMRIPNFLQNLFGEGVLSASFIPVYARLLGRDEHEAADRVAGAVGVLLAIVTAVLTLGGILATPLLVRTVAAGFDAPTRELTIQLVRIVFPGIGLLVGSAWCLGILNSHRRFLLSYLSPVAWNLTIIGALLWWGGRETDARLATTLAWAAVAGSALQLLVQVPTVRRVAPALRASLGGGDPHVREVLRGFGPVLVGRGVTQISAYIDNSLASLVGRGAVTIFTNAQTLYLLPGSLFGMAVTAAELPAMASLHGADDEVCAKLRERLARSLRRIAYFVIPSAAAFLALGDVIAGAVFGYGRFSPENVRWVWATLAGSTVGLLAATQGRLYASTFYALRDTRTPLRFALVRIGLNLVLGYLAARHLPRIVGLDPRWGTVGLTASAGLVGWLEFSLLRAALTRRVGAVRIPPAATAKLWDAAARSAPASWGAKLAVGAVGVPATGPGRLAVAAVVCGTFGAAYLALTAALGEGESATIVAKLKGRRGRRGRA